MKNLKLIAVTLTLMITAQPFILHSFQRKAGSTALRSSGLFTKGRTSLGRTVSATNARSSTLCPNAGRSFSSSTASSFGNKARSFGTRAREFAGRHPKKLWFAGTAGAVGTAYGINKKRNKTQLNLLALQDSLRYLSSKNINTIKQIEIEVAIDDIITWLEKNGGINTKDVNGKTPLMMVLESNIRDQEKLEIIDTLIEHGARPTIENLHNVLYTTSDLKTLLQNPRLLHYAPNNEALAVLLPYYDKDTLFLLKEIAVRKVDDLKKLKELRPNAYYKTFIEPEIESYRYLKSLVDTSLFKNSGQLTVAPFKEIDETVTQYKAKNYKEEDWTVAR